MDDFRAPQPLNVEIGPEPEVTPHARQGVDGPSLAVVPQEITPDVDLYPLARRGMQPGVIR